jgi:hypothetical protein
MKTVNTEFKRMQKKQSFSGLQQMQSALFFLGFQSYFNLLDRFSKSTQILNSVKIHPVEAKLFHPDRWMDRQDEAFHNTADVPNKRLYIKTIILQRRGIRLHHIKRRS